jgi:hypothetical protein
MAKSSSPLEPRVRFPATDSYWAEIEARLQRLEHRFDMLHKAASLEGEDHLVNRGWVDAECGVCAIIPRL